MSFPPVDSALSLFAVEGVGDVLFCFGALALCLCLIFRKGV